jgi:transcription factor WhiB
MDLSAVITRGVGTTDRLLWQLVVEQGACSTSGLSPDDWYPVSTQAEAATREAASAIAVCSACRVREECLELALRNWAVGQHGVWGGTVPGERERLRAGRVAQYRTGEGPRPGDEAPARGASRLLFNGHGYREFFVPVVGERALLRPVLGAGLPLTAETAGR